MAWSPEPVSTRMWDTDPAADPELVDPGPVSLTHPLPGALTRRLLHSEESANPLSVELTTTPLPIICSAQSAHSQTSTSAKNPLRAPA